MIAIFSPVAGFLPSRSFVSFIMNFPKFLISTSSPDASADLIVIITKFNIFSPFLFEIDFSFEISSYELILSMRSLLFNFIKFQVNEKAPRKGRNPATGEEMMMKRRRVVVFKCSSGLRAKIIGEKDKIRVY